MPIFEHDDDMTDKEFKRQQKELNKKIKRKEDDWEKFLIETKLKEKDK